MNHDSDLQKIIDAWAELPAEAKFTILKLVALAAQDQRLQSQSKGVGHDKR